jgi:hypothetical protein
MDKVKDPKELKANIPKYYIPAQNGGTPLSRM